MKRKDFINTIIKWSLWGILAMLAVMLGRKASVDNDCASCPEYASCTDIAGCKFSKTARSGR